MPIKFYRYGLNSLDPGALSPEEQAEVTHAEFLRQQAEGRLPADAIDGGFRADTEKRTSVRFLHRRLGGWLALNAKAGDRICVATYAGMIQSTVDACETLEWANMAHVGLIFLDLGVDSSTAEGKRFLDMLAKIKDGERRRIRLRTQAAKEHLRDSGLVSDSAPIGYEIKTVIPYGGPPLKYYMPCVPEREYGERIVIMHDQQGLSFERIAIKLWKHKVPQPRTGSDSCDQKSIARYYHHCKRGWPLHNGEAWKPPSFKFTVEDDTLDFSKCWD